MGNSPTAQMKVNRVILSSFSGAILQLPGAFSENALSEPGVRLSFFDRTDIVSDSDLGLLRGSRKITAHPKTATISNIRHADKKRGINS